MRYSQQRWPVGGDDDSYGHSTGRLRLLETRLLTTVELENAVRQTAKSGWQQLLDKLAYPQADDLLTRISKAREEADSVLKELCVEKSLCYGLLLQQTYHNLKVFLKALLPANDLNSNSMQTKQNTGIPVNIQDLLFGQSYEDPEQLWQMVIKTLMVAQEKPIDFNEWQNFTEEFIGFHELKADSFIRTGLPKILADSVMAARYAYTSSGEVGRIDAVLDQYYFAHLAALAKCSKNKFLRTYVCLKADLANINILYRSILMKLDKDVVQGLWVPGGQTTVEEFVKLLDSSSRDWHIAFAGTPVEEIVDIAYNMAHPSEANNEIAGSFARKADNLVMDLAQTGLQVVYGPQVVAGYWLAKQAETQNLRLILSLEAQGKESSELLNLIREAYIHG